MPANLMAFVRASIFFCFGFSSFELTPLLCIDRRNVVNAISHRVRRGAMVAWRCVMLMLLNGL